MSGIGIGGFILIVILALILFGPKKLPELGRAVGVTLREFKKATSNLTKDDDDDKEQTVTRATVTNATTPTAALASGAVVEKGMDDRAQLEKEIRERLERERLETEIRAKIEQERLQAKTEESKG